MPTRTYESGTLLWNKLYSLKKKSEGPMVLYGGEGTYLCLGHTVHIPPTSLHPAKQNSSLQHQINFQFILLLFLQREGTDFFYSGIWNLYIPYHPCPSKILLFRPRAQRRYFLPTNYFCTYFSLFFIRFTLSLFTFLKYLYSLFLFMPEILLVENPAPPLHWRRLIFRKRSVRKGCVCLWI
jgi:hypothetical protein